MPTVLAVFGENVRGAETIGACEIYRITLPFHTLQEHDPRWDMRWTAVGDIPRYELVNQILRADIIVMPRWWTKPEYTDEAAGFFNMVHDLNKKIVYECDDDYSNQSRVVHDGGDTSIELASMSDAITVSTPHLGKLMKGLTGKPVYVAPNCVAPELWDGFTAMPRPDRLTIGLAGTKTHMEDWRVLGEVLPNILADYPDVQLTLVHFHPDYLLNISDRVVLHPGSPYKEYPAVINQIDILLAPVNPRDDFNLSKSGIKAIEGMAAKRSVGKNYGGACVLATNMPIYRRVISHKSNGLLVEHTPEAWDAAIRQVIEDDTLRTRLQIKGYKWVRQRHIQNHWKTWRKIYSTVLGE